MLVPYNLVRYYTTITLFVGQDLFILAINVLIWARLLQSPETFRVHSRAQRVIVTAQPG